MACPLALHIKNEPRSEKAGLILLTKPTLRYITYYVDALIENRVGCVGILPNQLDESIDGAFFVVVVFHLH
jgi:hypothetical protein